MNEISLRNGSRSWLDMSLRDVTVIVVAITMFLSISPFFVWSSFAGGIGGVIFKGLQLLSIALMLIHLPIRNMSQSKFVCGLAILVIFFYYCFFTGVESGTTHPLLIGNFLVYFFYALTAMSDRDILVKSFHLLRIIFAAVLSYTIIIHVLLLLRIPIPYVTLQSGEAGRVAAGQQVYQNYLGCLLIRSNGVLMYRFTSVFTEPGVVGTFCAFFLAADDCNISKNKQNKLFLISGILSLSLAFFVMVIIAFALKSLRKGGYKLFVGLMAILVFYFVFININFSSPGLSALQDRLVITEDGLAGDNRISEEAEKEYQAFLNGDLETLLFGYGYPKVDPRTGISKWQSAATYKESVYCLGVLGYLMLLAWFIITPLYCYRSDDPRKNRLMYSFMTIFIISQYQRPYMKSLFLVYILLAGCLYAQQSTSDSSEAPELSN